jgi:hypothetical protein
MYLTRLLLHVMFFFVAFKLRTFFCYDLVSYVSFYSYNIATSWHLLYTETVHETMSHQMHRYHTVLNKMRSDAVTLGIT